MFASDHDEERKPRVRIGMYGNGEVRIEGLTQQQINTICAAFGSGVYWVRSVNGTFESYSNLKPLPGPVDDEEMLPFWRKPTSSELEQVPTLFEFEKLPNYSLPSISIQHLCGHYYSPERYKSEANKLESYGFKCLRSRRGDDARYWEVWYLPSLWFAEGDLKQALQEIKDDKDKLFAALDLLARNVVFGSLDVSVQRLAMPNPE